ncbi:hypothetical protein NDGK_00260 [Clostridiales bacterium CHKCI001]|nr:hypothetical protein NDGK_00260 [Clostridiales bacterium CHKCI001]
MRKKFLSIMLAISFIISMSSVASAQAVSFPYTRVDDNEITPLASAKKDITSNFVYVSLYQILRVDGTYTGYQQIYGYVLHNGQVIGSATLRGATTGGGVVVNNQIICNRQIPAGSIVNFCGMGHTPGLDCLASGIFNAS